MNTWNIDQVHSEIGFKIKHLMVSTVRGRFTQFDGGIEIPNEDLTEAQFNFTAQTTSIDTGNEMRDQHLRSAEFFNVEEYPTLSFTSTEVTKQDDSNFVIKGNLTMHNQTKEISLDAIFNGNTVGLDGDKVISFDITGTLSRDDFDLSWNKTLETGGLTLSDEVKIDIVAEFKETK